MTKRHKQNHVQKRPPRRFGQPWLWALSGTAVVLSAILIGLWVTSGQPEAKVEVNGVPRLRVDREKIDLGEVQLGQTVEVAFEVTNVGDKPLYFKETPYIEVAAGC